MFPDEIKILKNKMDLPTKNRLLNLTPFLDSSGVLRVGGRLEYSDLTYPVKHPILLCKSHPIAKLIIEYTHKKTLTCWCIAPIRISTSKLLYTRLQKSHSKGAA